MENPKNPMPQEPDLSEAFSDDGVDLTLIRWMLDLSPLERLQAAQDLIDSVWALRGMSALGPTE